MFESNDQTLGFNSEMGWGQNLFNGIGNAWNMLSGQYGSQMNDMAFQEYMRDTQYQSLFEQAEKLGISPSLLLGEKGVSSGVSGATGTAGSGNAVGGVINGILSAVTKIFETREKGERLEDRLQAQKEMQASRNNTAKEINERRNANAVTTANIYTNYREEKYREQELEKSKRFLENHKNLKAREQKEKEDFSKWLENFKKNNPQAFRK